MILYRNVTWEDIEGKKVQIEYKDFVCLGLSSDENKGQFVYAVVKGMIWGKI